MTRPRRPRGGAAAGVPGRGFPIEGASHADVRRYHVKDGALLVDDLPLVQPRNSSATAATRKAPDAVLLRNNGLHVELVFDRAHFIGAATRPGSPTCVLESALSAIMDCEDSVACVDAEDKVQAYGNWLGLMKGDLTEEVAKGGKPMTRRLNPDRDLTGPDGSPFTLKGRALMLVRNVGHLMTNPPSSTATGEVPEGLMDAMSPR
jgi:malate synthase